MMRLLSLVATTLALLSAVASSTVPVAAAAGEPTPPTLADDKLLRKLTASDKIDHVVVLMMENHSFDSMIGWAKSVNPEIDGLTGDEYQLLDVDDPSSPRIYVNKRGPDTPLLDPGHSFDETTFEIYGYDKPEGVTGVPKMNGFVTQATTHKHVGRNLTIVDDVMSCFTAASDSAPVIHTLLHEFAVFDRWYGSIPGPTDPNRAMAMSGTAEGVLHNYNGTLLAQQSYFDFLTAHDVEWAAYYQDDPWAILYFEDMYHPHNLKNIHPLHHFAADVKAGALPAFTWLQPRLSSVYGPPTWQHPDSSVREGERLIKHVYETLRNAPTWERTAFVLTYDEHGGFYDHVAPPQTGVPSPSGRTEFDVGEFAFNRLGPRVPTVIASPWIPPNTVVHEPTGPTPTSQFEHTSVMATVNALLGIDDHLTKRSAWAGTFESVFSLDSPRTDTLTSLPTVPMWTKEDMTAHAARGLNHHIDTQIAFYCRAHALSNDECPTFKTQGQAARWLHKMVPKLFAKLDGHTARQVERDVNTNLHTETVAL